MQPYFLTIDVHPDNTHDEEQVNKLLDLQLSRKAVFFSEPVAACIFAGWAGGTLMGTLGLFMQSHPQNYSILGNLMNGAVLGGFLGSLAGMALEIANTEITGKFYYSFMHSDGFKSLCLSAASAGVSTYSIKMFAIAFGYSEEAANVIAPTLMTTSIVATCYRREISNGIYKLGQNCARFFSPQKEKTPVAASINHFFNKLLKR